MGVREADPGSSRRTNGNLSSPTAFQIKTAFQSVTAPLLRYAQQPVRTMPRMAAPSPRMPQQIKMQQPRPPMSPQGSFGEGIKLFVGGLPSAYGDAEVLELFGQMGDVLEVHVMRQLNGDSKGSAFVRYATPEAAQMATEHFDHKVVLPGMSRPVEVRLAVDSSKRSVTMPRYAPY